MADTDGSVVVTAGLTKHFRDFWLREKVAAVEDLDVQIGPREIYGLLGPNGSGKTTTLKMILSLLFPTRGRIAVFGGDPASREVKSRIGYLPEDSHFYSFLDARETLDYYGKLFGLSRRIRRRRIDTLLEMVGLSGAAYRRVGEYSKGMKRRIGLAQALINDPDLVILDEPTAGLDPMGTRMFKDLLGSLADRGKTVILSSHLLADVEDVCDRICILYGGRKQVEGKTEQLLSRGGCTQIVTDALDEETLARLTRFLDGSGAALHTVSAPRDRLESLFLRVVEEAGSRSVPTGGAGGGGVVAGFLRGEEEGDELIESLVTKSAGESDAGDDAVDLGRADDGGDAETSRDGADESVISALTGVGAERSQTDGAPADDTRAADRNDDAQTETSAGSADASGGDADEAFIRGLIRRRENKEGEADS